MGTTTTLVTVQEFLKMPETEGEFVELIGGEVISLPKAGCPHEVTKSNVIRVLTAWSLQNPALRLFCEAAYQIDEQTCLIPDISMLASNRMAPGSTGIFHGAPEIAIEVVSSESVARLVRKIQLYLAHGSQSVWAIYPEDRIVRIDDATGGAKRFEHDQTLVDPVLTGFAIPTSAIFAGV